MLSEVVTAYRPAGNLAALFVHIKQAVDELAQFRKWEYTEGIATELGNLSRSIETLNRLQADQDEGWNKELTRPDREDEKRMLELLDLKASNKQEFVELLAEHKDEIFGSLIYFNLLMKMAGKTAEFIKRGNDEEAKAALPPEELLRKAALLEGWTRESITDGGELIRENDPDADLRFAFELKQNFIEVRSFRKIYAESAIAVGEFMVGRSQLWKTTNILGDNPEKAFTDLQNALKGVEVAVDAPETPLR